MKRIGLFILLPLIVAAVAGSTALYFRQMHNWNNLQLFVIGCGIFCAALVLINHWRLSSQLIRMQNLEDGITEYESSITKRMNVFSREMVRQSSVVQIKRQIAILENNNLNAGQKPDVSAEERSKLGDKLANFNTQNSFYLDDENGNVISFELAKRGTVSDPEDLSTPKTKFEPAKLIKAGQMKIYLQPKVTVQDRSVLGYEVFAQIKLDDGSIVPAEIFMKAFSNARQIREMDSNVIEQTMSLLRAFRRNDQHPLLFMNVSSQTFINKKAFDEFMDVLRANHVFADNLIIEVSQRGYAELEKKHLSKLGEIRELGYSLSMDDCTNILDTLQVIENGMFGAIKMPASLLEELDRDDRITSDLDVVSIAEDAGVSLIITHVEKQHQVIQLIDNNIGIAQGFLFSDPKPPSVDQDDDKAAGNHS